VLSQIIPRVAPRIKSLSWEYLASAAVQPQITVCSSPRIKKRKVNSDRSCIIQGMEQAPTPLLLRQREMRLMSDQVRGLDSEEVCGLLGGNGNVVEVVIPVENILHSPFRFRMEPRAQLRAMQAIEDAGLSLIGIYHSHPGGPPGPSSQDLRDAAYLDAAYLIWSPTRGGWMCRAFRLEQAGPRPIRLLDPQDAGGGAESRKAIDR